MYMYLNILRTVLRTVQSCSASHTNCSLLFSITTGHFYTLETKIWLNIWSGVFVYTVINNLIVFHSLPAVIHPLALCAMTNLHYPLPTRQWLTKVLIRSVPLANQKLAPHNFIPDHAVITPLRVYLKQAPRSRYLYLSHHSFHSGS